MTSRLDAIRQREQAATKGPWTWTEGFLWNVTSDVGVLNHKAGWDVTEEDEAFISHSREDIPLLLAIAEKARLRRNSRWAKDKSFEGEWVVIPKEDFDALWEAVAALDVEEQP